MLGHTQYRREKHVEQQWREHACLPEILPHVIRALSITQPHACLHAVVELVDDGEHSRWHTKTSKDTPQKGSVDGAICFGEVDKAQVQGSVLLPRQFLQSSYYEHKANRRALGSEPTLFLRQNVFAFTIVTQATRDDFEEYFAGVSLEGDATIIATLSPIVLLVKHLSCCIFPLLRHATSPPPDDDDIVELSEGVQFSFVGQNLQELGRETIGPYRFRFANARIASSTSYLDWTSSSGLHRGHCLSSSTILGSRVGDLVLSSL